ncbi:MAG: TetR/AcrR family transcriptional regulator [Leptospirales bacterium]|nr:TetR/AcrR family transcriptional regulator [Leptospirales bacterium]
MDLFGKYGIPDLSRFSVREIKFARARLGVLQAFARMLKKTDYRDIRIKDLSRVCEISEPSFYNYFPQKDDLFLYFISLWSVDVQLHTQNVRPGLAAIHEIFQYTASSTEQNPALLREIISYQARTDTSLSVKGITPVSLAEKTIAFGSVPDLDRYPDQGLGPVLEANLKAALKNRELQAGASVQVLNLVLASVFFGLPVIVMHQSPKSLGDYYRLAIDEILPRAKKRGKK